MFMHTQFGLVFVDKYRRRVELNCYFTSHWLREKQIFMYKYISHTSPRFVHDLYWDDANWALTSGRQSIVFFIHLSKICRRRRGSCGFVCSLLLQIQLSSNYLSCGLFCIDKWLRANEREIFACVSHTVYTRSSK